MFLKKLDFISPTITIYYKGSLIHSSIVSGILSIISVLFIISMTLHYLFDIIQKKNYIVNHIESYIDDAPIYKVNSSSFFHFLNMVSVGKINRNEGIDFTKLRIIGSNSYYSTFNNNNIKRRSHWLYGKCDNIAELKEIGYLINNDIFQKSACINKYFDPKTQKYYDMSSPNFQWPEIGHGLSNDNNIIYSIFVGNCNEETIEEVMGIGSYCKNETEIREYFQEPITQKVFHLYFLDHYINNTDYKSPNKPFFSRLETALEIDKMYINNMKYNPSIIRTDSSIFIGNSKEEEISYIYDRNAEVVKEKKDFYIVYGFFLKNVMIQSERIYTKLQELFSTIGGFFNFAQMLAFYINYFYNSYICLFDTQLLLNDLIKTEKTDINFNKNLIKNFNNFINSEDIDKNPKEKDKKYISSSSRVKESSESNIKVEFNHKNKTPSNNININNINYNIDINKIKNLVLNNENKENNENSENNENNENNENTKTKLKKSNISFFKFLIYKFCCDKKNTYFDVYSNFRMKIISEEHFLRNHLNVCNLLKLKEKGGGKRIMKKLNYKIDNLINLV